MSGKRAQIASASQNAMQEGHDTIGAASADAFE
jgi:hypothetical protein